VSSAKSSTSNAPSPLQSSSPHWGVGSSPALSAIFGRRESSPQRMPVSRMATRTSGRPIERFQARSAETPGIWPSGLRPASVFWSCWRVVCPGFL
jgi:hypothetical protein